MNILKDGERLDDLHRNGYKIIQSKDGFCFGMDGVLLSHFADTKENDTVFDIGTGTGVIPILMSAKKNAKKYFAIDIQKNSVDMAKRSVHLNSLEDKIHVMHLDVKDIQKTFEKSSIDVVTSNPPYMNAGKGIVNKHSEKMIARHEIYCSLEDIIENAHFLLKPKGKFYMVHRPNRLVDIICMLRKYKLEPKAIRLVEPYKNKEPNIVLIESVKDGNPFLKALPTLTIYGEDKKYTKEIYDIYNK